MGFSSWLLRRKATAGVAKEMIPRPAERSPPPCKSHHADKEKTRQVDRRKKPEDEQQREGGSKRAGLPSCASCLPKCLLFGRRSRGEAKASQKTKPKKEDSIEEEAATCLNTSGLSTLPGEMPDGEASPLPPSAETPRFLRQSSSGENQERPGGQEDDGAIPCFDYNDESSSVNDLRWVYGGANDFVEVVEWFFGIDDGVVTTGLYTRNGEEVSATVVRIDPKEEETSFPGEDKEDPEETRVLSNMNRCLGDVDQPMTSGEEEENNASLPDITDLVVSAAMKVHGSSSVGLRDGRAQPDLSDRSHFTSSLDARRVCFLEPVLSAWGRRELVGERNQRRARFLEAGERLANEDHGDFVHTRCLVFSAPFAGELEEDPAPRAIACVKKKFREETPERRALFFPYQTSYVSTAVPPREKYKGKQETIGDVEGQDGACLKWLEGTEKREDFDEQTEVGHEVNCEEEIGRSLVNRTEEILFWLFNIAVPMFELGARSLQTALSEWLGALPEEDEEDTSSSPQGSHLDWQRCEGYANQALDRTQPGASDCCIHEESLQLFY